VKRLLLPIDDQKCCQKALDYAVEQYAGVPGVEVTLVHVLPGVPALFWDDGHILQGGEAQERSRWVGSWQERHRRKIEPVLAAAAARLLAAGFGAAQVTTRVVDDADDVAQALLEEARRGGHRTILVGRCGIAEGRHFLVGSVTSRLIHHGAGVAVCIVE
jgi:nucleotide-binding universal stress UspA family protein